MRRSFACPSFLMFLLLATLPGCMGRVSPNDAAVTGVVRLQQQPVAGAVVSASTGTRAQTDGDGVYCLAVPLHQTVRLSARYVMPGQSVGTLLGTADVKLDRACICGQDAMRQDIALTDATPSSGPGRQAPAR